MILLNLSLAAIQLPRGYRALLLAGNALICSPTCRILLEFPERITGVTGVTGTFGVWSNRRFVGAHDVGRAEITTDLAMARFSLA